MKPYAHALVRPPGSNFAQGLSSSNEGSPDASQALIQHQRYCEALCHLGLELTSLAATLQYPDGTFVEDTAVLLPGAAIVTRPGAPSRQGEVASVYDALQGFFPEIHRIQPPGTVDGGDVCAVEDHFFIGHSARTNEDGVRQLTGILARAGFGSTVLDIRGNAALLHLKSGLAYLGNRQLVLSAAMRRFPGLSAYEPITLAAGEAYAANCLAMNGRVLIAAGYPGLGAELRARGYAPVELEMSEFRKMDGGLSCLSLRF